MPYIGFRATDALANAVDKVAELNKMSRSEVVREACEKFVFDQAITPESQSWKPVCWNFFGTDLHKINYGLARAETPEEFFSMLSKWTKYDLGVQILGDKLTVTVDKGNVLVTAEIVRDGPKERIIRDLIFELEKSYISKATEDFSVEEEI